MSAIRLFYAAVTALAFAGCAATETPAQVREISADEVRLLDRAEQVLTDECMARFGFHPPQPVRQPRVREWSFPYIIDDVAWAREHGYGHDLRDQQEKQSEADPVRRYYLDLPPERRTAAVVALNGARPEGLEVRLPSRGVVRRSDRSCTSEAQRALYGDLPAWYRASKIVANLSPLWVERVMADAKFTAAVSQWSVCVRQRGFPYDTPDQLRNAMPQKDRAEEIRFAVAEAECAVSTDLSAVAHDLDAHYSGIVREEYRQDIVTKQRLSLEALPRAQQIVNR